VKYDIAVIASVLLAAVLIGATYVDSERTARSAVIARATVSRLSIQRLAPEIATCDSLRGHLHSRDPRLVYCTEVIRAMDTQPLQAVVIAPKFEDVESFPAPSLPWPKLLPLTVPEPRVPMEPATNVIFDIASIS
jgi:hypothetical protein